MLMPIHQIHLRHVVSLHPCSRVHPAHTFWLNTQSTWSWSSPHAASFFSFSSLFLHAILEAILCDVGEFHCLNEETCIPEAWLCDGEPDCPDDSDETDTICKSLIASIDH